MAAFFLRPTEGAMPKVIANRSTLDQAIQRAQEFLLSTQAPDGHWRGELEADSTVTDRKSTRLNSSHIQKSRMPSSA